MRTARLLYAVAAVLLMSTGIWAADEAGSGVKPETIKYYQDIKADVAKLNESAVVKKYSPELIEKANAAIESAQNGLKALSDQETRQSSEIASLLVKLAQTVTAERQATDKTVATRNELTQLEQRLTDILAGKGEKP